jgi:hypothetical protein
VHQQHDAVAAICRTASLKNYLLEADLSYVNSGMDAVHNLEVH